MDSRWDLTTPSENISESTCIFSGIRKHTNLWLILISKSNWLSWNFVWLVLSQKCWLTQRACPHLRLLYPGKQIRNHFDLMTRPSPVRVGSSENFAYSRQVYLGKSSHCEAISMVKLLNHLITSFFVTVFIPKLKYKFNIERWKFNASLTINLINAPGNW